MPGNEAACIVIVQFHRIHVKILPPVANNNHGQLAVSLFKHFFRMGQHGKNNARHAHIARKAQGRQLALKAAVGGIDAGGIALERGGLLHGLNNGGIIWIGDIGGHHKH